LCENKFTLRDDEHQHSKNNVFHRKNMNHGRHEVISDQC
jgi:hypothetical protein